MKEKLKKEDYKHLTNDSWLYILLLSTLLILSESLKSYNIIKGYSIPYSIFIIPLLFLLINFIVKRYGYKKGILAILLSLVNLVLFISIMNLTLGSEVAISMISGEVLGYLISGLTNLFIYNFLLKNTKSPRILVFINYIFSFVVFYLVFTVVQVDMIILEQFWKGYFITICIQGIESLGLTYLDSRIKEGI